MLIWLKLALLGVLVGCGSGLLGIGGGVISTPTLIVLLPHLQIDQSLVIQLAIGSSLAISGLTLIASLSQHYKNNNIDLGIFYQFLPGIVFGALVGPYIVHMLPALILKKIIALLFIVLAINLTFSYRVHKGVTLPSHFIMVISGFFFGLLATLVGVSGALFIIPFLNLFGVSMRRAVGVAAISGVPIATLGTLSYIVIGYHMAQLPAGAVGYVYLPAVIAIVIVSMPVAYVAVKVSNKVPTYILRRLLASLLIIVSIKMALF